jgi:hypothetical protein
MGMEEGAYYHPAAPKGPCNLAQPLVAWLWSQGFSTQLQELPDYHVLTT